MYIQLNKYHYQWINHDYLNQKLIYCNIARCISIIFKLGEIILKTSFQIVQYWFEYKEVLVIDSDEAELWYHYKYNV